MCSTPRFHSKRGAAPFLDRAQFFRNIGPESPPALQRMVDDWYRLGVVTEQPGPGDPAFPPIFKVETDNEFPT